MRKRSLPLNLEPRAESLYPAYLEKGRDMGVSTVDGCSVNPEYDVVPPNSFVYVLPRAKYPLSAEANRRFREVKNNNSWTLLSERYTAGRYWCWRVRRQYDKSKS